MSNIRSKSASFENRSTSILAMIALSAVQSSTQTQIHNAIIFLDIATMLDTPMLILKYGGHV